MKKVLKATAIVAGLVTVAGVVYAICKHFEDDSCHRCHCDDDWDDEYDDDWDDDDWDDDFEDDEEKENSSEEDSHVSIKVE